MKKVRDIRWILKRRYLKARNFQRIFNYWDLDHTGKVSAQNIYDMCNKLAINVNPRECEAILATADRTGSGFLGPDDFLDLIYNDVDPMTMPDLKVPVNSSIVPSEQVPDLLQKLSDQAKKQRDNRHYNQVRFVLKNRLKQLAKDFKRQV